MGQPPRSGSLNDLMQSYFGRIGQITHVTLCSNATAPGIQIPSPITAVQPEAAAALVVKGRTWHQLTVTGTFDATLQLEVTNDGENWFALAPFNLAGGSTATTAAITEAGMYSYRGIFDDARVNVTAYTSGSVSADLRSVLI